MPALIHSPRIGDVAVDMPLEIAPLGVSFSDRHSLTMEVADSDSESFHLLLSAASRIHDTLQARTECLEAENQRLQVELGKMRLQTPRPEASPTALMPEIATPRDDAHCAASTPRNEISCEVGTPPSATYWTSTHYSPASVDILGEKDMLVNLRPGDLSAGSTLSNYNGSEGQISTPDMTSALINLPPTPKEPSTDAIRTVSQIHRSEQRKMYEVRRKFNRLDRNSSGHIHSQLLEDLLEKHAKKKKKRIISGLRLPSCADVMKAVNASLEDDRSSTSAANIVVSERDGETMDFDQFTALMLKEDLQQCFSADVCDKILIIRDVLAREEMTKLVARFAHVATQELSHHRKRGNTFACIRQYLDPVSIVAISLNAILMGVSADLNSEWSGWDVIEYLFTGFFLVELTFKIGVDGLETALFGKDAIWNMLDLVIVTIAVIDAFLNTVVNPETSSMHLFTILRLARLARITRLVRLLRFKIFKELLLMVRGIFAGMRTMLWAVVLLSLFIFMCGMLMRQTMGRWCDPEKRKKHSDLCIDKRLQEYGMQMFSTVPRSCLTVFRCFTDGCAAPDGTPLIVHVYEDSKYGPLIVLIYVLSFLFVTFGLFNLIMAVFVENTMESAKYDERKRQQLRHAQAVHVARKLQRLLFHFGKATHPSMTASEFMSGRPSQGIRRRFSKLFKRIRGKGPEWDETDLPTVGLDMEITRATFARVVADPYVEQLLDGLDIAVTDPMDLFDTLDADSSGSIDVSELIKGLMKLRGTAEKSDVVACLLAIRAMQNSLAGLEKRVDKGFRKYTGIANGNILSVKAVAET